MYKGRQKKFGSYRQALEYLEQRGKLVFFGRIGERAERYVYSFNPYKGGDFGLFIDEDGTVEIFDQK